MNTKPLLRNELFLPGRMVLFYFDFFGLCTVVVYGWPVFIFPWMFRLMFLHWMTKKTLKFQQQLFEARQIVQLLRFVNSSFHTFQPIVFSNNMLLLLLFIFFFFYLSDWNNIIYKRHCHQQVDTDSLIFETWCKS